MRFGEQEAELLFEDPLRRSHGTAEEAVEDMVLFQPAAGAADDFEQHGDRQVLAVHQHAVAVEDHKLRGGHARIDSAAAEGVEVADEG